MLSLILVLQNLGYWPNQYNGREDYMYNVYCFLQIACSAASLVLESAVLPAWMLPAMLRDMI